MKERETQNKEEGRRRENMVGLEEREEVKERKKEKEPQDDGRFKPEKA